MKGAILNVEGRHGAELVAGQHHPVFELVPVLVRHGEQFPTQVLDHEPHHEVLGLILLGEHQEDGGLVAGKALSVQRAVEADRLLQLRIQKGVQPGQHCGQHRCHGLFRSVQGCSGEPPGFVLRRQTAHQHLETAFALDVGDRKSVV